jgi:hypothetical protein
MARLELCTRVVNPLGITVKKAVEKSRNIGIGVGVGQVSKASKLCMWAPKKGAKTPPKISKIVILWPVAPCTLVVVVCVYFGGKK